jgi:GTP-binding protein Era
MMEAPPETGFRSGYVVIIGVPNVGKSTLLNKLIGQKLSIVTAKPQTTRHRILGILSQKNAQVIFVDTPGLLTPTYRLQETMMQSAHAAIAEADLVLFMTDFPKLRSQDDPGRAIALRALQTCRRPVYLVINKVDVVSREEALTAIAIAAQTYPFKEVFPISALEGRGVGELLASVISELPDHPPYYPPDILSEHSERFFVSEIIREKIFEQYAEEIPYSTTVDVIDFQERKGRKDLINAEIYVERDSQKGILIGKGGKALKEIGEKARKDIEHLLDRPVFLELHVKVREQWRNKEEWLKRLGYT